MSGLGGLKDESITTHDFLYNAMVHRIWHSLLPVWGALIMAQYTVVQRIAQGFIFLMLTPFIGGVIVYAWPIILLCIVIYCIIIWGDL